MWNCNGTTASLNVLSSGKGIGTFINYYVMLNIQKLFFSALSSLKRTSAAEKAKCLTGNPYVDFQNMGFVLEQCTICYHGKNQKGHCITGRFLIGGCEQTGGANSYEELILFVATKATGRREWYKTQRKIRREAKAYAYA